MYTIVEDFSPFPLLHIKKHSSVQATEHPLVVFTFFSVEEAEQWIEKNFRTC